MRREVFRVSVWFPLSTQVCACACACALVSMPPGYGMFQDPSVGLPSMIRLVGWLERVTTERVALIPLGIQRFLAANGMKRIRGRDRP
jgi:hypothetical protein